VHLFSNQFLVQDNALYQATCLPVYADSESSANSLKNLGGNSKSQQPQPQPQPKSLADKLLDTMRYLALETDLKINVPV
jgi:hypothetical protein